MRPKQSTTVLLAMPLQIPSSLTPQLDGPVRNNVSPPAARNTRRNNSVADAIA
jgi:hypothetical protein